MLVKIYNLKPDTSILTVKKKIIDSIVKRILLYDFAGMPFVIIKAINVRSIHETLGFY